VWSTHRLLAAPAYNCVICVHQASPSTPVRVVGITEFPRAGEDLLVVPSEERAKSVLEGRSRRDTVQVARCPCCRHAVCALVPPREHAR
jgi:hypothetical protein